MMDILGFITHNLIYFVCLGLIVYIIITKLQAKENEHLNEIKKELEINWGKEQLKRLTNEELENIFKFSEKVNKTLYKGLLNLGKVIRIVRLKEGYLLKVKKPKFLNIYLFADTFYFYLNNDEVLSETDQKIDIKNSDINCFAGIYVLEINDKKKEKIENLSFLSAYQDVVGRLEHLSRKIAYLELEHAQQSDLMSKRLDALTQLSEREVKRF